VCPTCEQPLGDAFEQVQAHHRTELARVESAHAALVAEHAKAAKRAAKLANQRDAAVVAFRAAQQAWSAAEQARTRRVDAEQALSRAQAALGRAVEADEVDVRRADVRRRRAAAAEVQRLSGQLERRPHVESARLEEDARRAEAEGKVTMLREKVKALGHSSEALDSAREALARASTKVHATSEASTAARVALGRAESLADAARERLVDAEVQHAKVAERVEDARHLGRLADLLNAFRTSVVATVGPRLSAQAADLFAELTDREYDLLRVDPETYEIEIVDDGRPYGMDRFSGSETDLANLALRVAISEHVRFQSGGAVGLLVLDEVFGPLDDERKERMLIALERLRGRFRQVLVVTHATDIKEQLPMAIEVTKLSPRRATARVVTGR
jgi:DNA repair exonuclease SbcCD ATPase subunit